MGLNLKQVDLHHPQDQPQAKSNGKPPPKKAPDIARAMRTINSPGRKLGAEWLKSYLEYVSDTESPENFHFWTALSCVSSVAQRKIYLSGGAHFTILPNLYVVLIGPPGAGKTVAINIGRELLSDIPIVNFASSMLTPASLVQEIGEIPDAGNQSLTAFNDEFGSFFTSNPAEMVDITTDLFDGRKGWSKRTVGRGKEKLTAPWLNILSGTTTSWLGSYLPAAALDGGFVSRTLFVYEPTSPLAKPFPELTERQKELRELLKNDLMHIASLSGEMKFGPDGKNFYDEWYQKFKAGLQTADNRTAGFQSRKALNVLKVAIILSLIESDDLVISETHLKASIAVIEALEPGIKRAFAGVGRNIHASDTQRIADEIKAAGRMQYKTVVNRNFNMLDKVRLDNILLQLEDMEVIRIDPQSKMITYVGKD